MDALRDAREEELDRSASGEWTPRQIAHHLADSEMTSAIRLRRLISEDSPVIYGYLTDEDWERTGTHTETGRYSVEDWLTIYARHGHDHAEQIRRSLGRP